MGSIYQIVNTITGAVYVGSSVRPAEARWAAHLKDLKGNRHHSRYLQRAWNKYGPTAFTLSLLEVDVPVTELIAREQFYLDQRKRLPQSESYNVCWVAGNCTGRECTTATRRRLSESHMGIPRSESSKRKQAATWTARYGGEYALQGPNGKVIRGITNLRAFARDNGLIHTALNLVVSGALKSHKGWSLPGYVAVRYTAVSPGGKKFTKISNLKEFSIKHGLHYKSMHKVLQGTNKTHRGWTVTAVGHRRQRQ